jgi:hypothetical protein
MKNIKCTELSNSSVHIRYTPDGNGKNIFVMDLTDRNNDPALTTTSKRGLAKAWDIVFNSFTSDTKMTDIGYILDKVGMKTHRWCMVD